MKKKKNSKRIIKGIRKRGGRPRDFLDAIRCATHGRIILIRVMSFYFSRRQIPGTGSPRNAVDTKNITLRDRCSRHLTRISRRRCILTKRFSSPPWIPRGSIVLVGNQPPLVILVFQRFFSISGVSSFMRASTRRILRPPPPRSAVYRKN